MWSLGYPEHIQRSLHLHTAAPMEHFCHVYIITSGADLRQLDNVMTPVRQMESATRRTRVFYFYQCDPN